MIDTKKVMAEILDLEENPNILWGYLRSACDHIDAQDEEIFRVRCSADLSIHHAGVFLATMKAQNKLIAKLVNVLIGLRGGGNCFCEVAIGNPMYSDHTESCKAAQEALHDME